MPPAPGDEAARRRDLRRMKFVATSLLVLAAVVYAVTRALEDSVTWLGPVRATAEAAMVGALADWFAVTALFRHPLRLPIPHTAIIPANKDRIGRTLGEFVRRNFLAPELVTGRVRDAQPARRAGVWLADPAHARSGAETVLRLAVGATDAVDDEDVSAAISTMLLSRARAVAAAPVVARVLEGALAEGHHHLAVERLLKSAGQYLEENRDALRERLRGESPWWVPGPIDDRVFTRLYEGAQRFLTEVADKREHELRQDIDQRLAHFAVRLRTDEELAARVEARKEELLARPEVQAWAASVWSELKDQLTRAATADESGLRRRLEGAVLSMGVRLRDDAALQATVDRWLTDAVAALVEQYGAGAAEYIATTVERWDPSETAERVELAVGRDLQFIRLNGTLVGGLAGLVIYLVGNLL
jgi:uncharacterized membrane-anchored protein YjiN (DUF445 family)